MSDLNAEPTAANGSGMTNPAKKTAAPTKRNVAKPTKNTPSQAKSTMPTPAPSRAAADVIFDLLTGAFSNSASQDLTAREQALLCAVHLERDRKQLVDANGKYVGHITLQQLVKSYLGDIPANRIATILRYLREDKVYSSEGVGKAIKITFHGSPAARDLIKRLVSEPPKGTTETKPGAMTAIPEGVNVFGGFELPDPLMGGMAHARGIADDVFRQAGYNMAIVAMVADRLREILDGA